MTAAAADLFDRTLAWFGRFISATDQLDLALLTLWTVHTHLVNELYTTPRLLIDSTMPGSGKTTVLDHFNRLCCRPVQAASLSSASLLARIHENGVRTVLVDEAHNSLRPDAPNFGDLIGVINSGYRVGATRPVLVPVKGGGWEPREMSTFGPVAIAGNNPKLPDDTRSRLLRVLLMPDYGGEVEDSDWELIEDDAAQLRYDIELHADQVSQRVKGMAVDLPKGCVGRAKEKWRPLKRVAATAGGDWPALADELIDRGLAEDEAERDAGLRSVPPGMVLLSDLHDVWPVDETFVPTRELVAKVIAHNPEYFGPASPFGKSLTEHRMGRLISQAAKVTSKRPNTQGPRGYLARDLKPVWDRLRLTDTHPP